MKNFATILVLLATSASFVATLPTEGNIPRAPGNNLQPLPIYAREPKLHDGKGKGSATANNVTTIANNGTANANNGKKSGKKGSKGKGNKGQGNNNNTTTVNAGKGQGNKNNGTSTNNGNGKGQSNGNAKDVLGQLITDLEAKLGINLGQNNEVTQNGQVAVADLLKLLGARDDSASTVARSTDRD
ncbi:hypothetical protein DL546_009822 [Coniochaeta pulveracea]|uniref:Uncharacterized protein n=1 Tax=Coniochaeta pulveracea TaxID=177199 RepID=A0A420YN96_9PEZI|nr:hypothetical protein DL546_009822 [Coniochaeta pulveracea]